LKQLRLLYKLFVLASSNPSLIGESGETRLARILFETTLVVGNLDSCSPQLLLFRRETVNEARRAVGNELRFVVPLFSLSPVTFAERESTNDRLGTLVGHNSGCRTTFFPRSFQDSFPERESWERSSGDCLKPNLGS